MPGRVDYDPTTGNARYVGMALPGTSPAAAAWRIGRPVFVGDVCERIDPADGNGNFDNVWNNRAALTYVANDTINWESAFVDVLPTPTGGFPATVFTVPFTIPDSADVWLDSTPMQRVVAAPDGNQVLISGATFTTGVPITAGRWFVLRVLL